MARKSDVTPSAAPPNRTAVVTGMGVVSPLGIDLRSNVTALQEGRSGLKRLSDSFFPDPRGREACRCGGPIDWHALDRLQHDISDRDRLDPATRLGVQAASEAMSAVSSGAIPNRDRLGVVVGTSKGGVRSLFRFGETFRTGGEADLFPESLPDAVGRHIARTFDARGPLLTPVAACATGLVCLIRAKELIEQGDCDAVIVGSADASLEPDVLAFFSRVGVLADVVGDPGDAVRPYAQDRSGFLVGEGAAMFLVERADLVAAHGRTPLANLGGSAFASDPAGLVTLSDEGDGLAYVMRTALRQSQREPHDVAALCLHGTATAANDKAEAIAVREVFGSAAPPAFSLKGHLGHLLGAAGSVETALAIASLGQRRIPPTRNLTHIADECAMTHPPACGSDAVSGSLLKVSLGFGGHLAALHIDVPTHD